jgi:hypothetical protein
VEDCSTGTGFVVQNVLFSLLFCYIYCLEFTSLEDHITVYCNFRLCVSNLMYVLFLHMQLISKKLRKKKVNATYSTSFYVYCSVYFWHQMGFSSKEYIFII